MSSLVRIISALCMSVLFTVTGCSTPVPQPTQSSDCVAEQCNGQEPSAHKCDDRPETIASVDKVVAGEVRGSLEVRKANPADCNRIYWGRFKPAADSKGAWELTFVRDDERTPVQKSEPGNPVIEAFTVVLHAAPGAEVQACVRDVASGKEVCTTKVAPS